MKISIITVTFNSASVIKDCLISVKSQEYKDIEHIIIDGASSDDTLSLLKSKQEQIDVLISESDKGIYHAMNKGLELASGEIIGFLNSDDFYATNSVLSQVVRTFKNNPSIDACYADLIYTARHDVNKNIRYWKSSKFTQGLFSKGWCPPHPTFFARSSVYKKFGGFNLDYSIASDVELMMRFLEINKVNALYISELWIKMRLGGITNNSFQNILKQNKEILYALKKHNLPNNWFQFFVNKIIKRSIQFLNK